MGPGSGIISKSLYPQTIANEAVILHDGAVVLRHDGGGANCNGTLALRWLPVTGLRLELAVLSGSVSGAGPNVKADLAGATTDVLIKSTSVSLNKGALSNRVVGIVSVIDVGAPEELMSVGFQVVNFSDFVVPGSTAASAFGPSPKTVELEFSGWQISLTPVQDCRSIFESLGETGGYAFTHFGRLQRVGGESFSARAAEPVLDALGSFLSFARGAACSLPIQWGIDANDAVVWQKWSSPVVAPWRDGQGWFDQHHGNLLAELFPAFAVLHSDASLGQPFRLALHWYLQCNTRAGGMEGAIILGLTALDLLGALVVVERAGSMSAPKYDDLPAKSKLAELLRVLALSDSFPNRTRDFGLFAEANGWSGTAVALTEIRHGYVHANRKRRDIVLAAPNMATFWAWQLCLWYQELALLRLLGHRGDYLNRMTAKWVGQVERVPWSGAGGPEEH